MVAVKLDLKDDFAIEIGANWDISIQLCGADDITTYVGKCQIAIGSNLFLQPEVIIINKTTFRLFISWANYPSNLTAGNYEYDVLFFKPGIRFYAVQGKATIIRRLTTLIEI